ncbi:DUF4249 family protein [candidate division KSB1 bacterium]|nr:DUF4249 family protein [candidate division KSB1 bacterium]
MKNISILACCCLLFACDGFVPKKEVYAPDYATEVNVFGMICYGGDDEFVVVERTMHVNEVDEWDINRTPNLIIDNAIVQIIGASDTVTFDFYCKPIDSHFRPDDYDYKGIYLDRRDEFQAQPGVSYELRVTVPGIGKLAATTQVPVRPSIIQPQTDTHIMRSAVKQATVSWTENSSIAAYLLNFVITNKRNPADRFNIITEELEYNSPARLTNVDDYYLTEQADLYSNNAVIKILAVDRNLYDYALKGSIALETGEDFRLVDGGRGVFGSYSVDSVNVVLD